MDRLAACSALSKTKLVVVPLHTTDNRESIACILRHLVADKILSRLGGRLRLAISGGAPLSPKLSLCFVGLGVQLLHGYGLTEAFPVVTANTREDNIPESVGVVLQGVEIKLVDRDELLVKGPNVMLGYCKNPDRTREAIDAEGWLHTGDVVRIEPSNHIFIGGRLKESLVMSTGEKISPSDLGLGTWDHRGSPVRLNLNEGGPGADAPSAAAATARRTTPRQAG